MKTGTFAADLQRAIYERLSGYPGMPPVYDDVPRDDAVSFPYVVIGDDTHTPWDTNSHVGAESTITLHVWSRQRGNKEAKEVQGLIYAALHREPLAIDQYDLITLEFEFSETFKDPDGLSRHGVSRFRSLADQPA